jgi:DNA-binding protein HU-beta
MARGTRTLASIMGEDSKTTETPANADAAATVDNSSSAPADTPATPQAPAKKATAAKKTAAKKTATKAAAKKAAASKSDSAPEAASGATSGPTKTAAKGKGGRAAKKAAETPAANATETEEERYRRTEPHVLAAKVKDAKQVSLYLHPDDWEWIKYDLRGGDIQAVLRSMIAIARNNQRLAEQVARLSRTAPRGGH